MPSNTGSSWVLSWRCPGVITIESGRPSRRRPDETWSSALRGCVRAPRWRVGDPFFYRLDCADVGRHSHADERAPWNCRCSPPRPPPPPHPIWSGRARGGDPRSLASPAIQPIRACLPRPVPLGQIPPRRPGAQLPQDPIDDGAMIPPLAASPAAPWQQRLNCHPRALGQLASSHHSAPLISFFLERG